MAHEIKLTNFFVGTGGEIEVNYEWNGNPMTIVYSNETEMNNSNADILQDPADVVRWLMFYLIALGHDAASMPTQIGKKLVVDIRPAVQQTIALV